MNTRLVVNKTRVFLKNKETPARLVVLDLLEHWDGTADGLYVETSRIPDQPFCAVLDNTREETSLMCPATNLQMFETEDGETVSVVSAIPMVTDFIPPPLDPLPTKPITAEKFARRVAFFLSLLDHDHCNLGAVPSQNQLYWCAVTATAFLQATLQEGSKRYSKFSCIAPHCRTLLRKLHAAHIKRAELGTWLIKQSLRSLVYKSSECPDRLLRHTGIQFKQGHTTHIPPDAIPAYAHDKYMYVLETRVKAIIANVPLEKMQPYVCALVVFFAPELLTDEEEEDIVKPEGPNELAFRDLESLLECAPPCIDRGMRPLEEKGLPYPKHHLRMLLVTFLFEVLTPDEIYKIMTATGAFENHREGPNKVVRDAIRNMITCSEPLKVPGCAFVRKIQMPDGTPLCPFRSTLECQRGGLPSPIRYAYIKMYEVLRRERAIEKTQLQKEIAATMFQSF